MNESSPRPELTSAARRAAVALFAAAALAAALPGAARAGEPKNPKPAGNLVQNPAFAEGLEHWDLMGNVRALAAGEVEITASESPLFLVVPAGRNAVAAAIEGRKP